MAWAGRNGKSLSTDASLSGTLPAGVDFIDRMGATRVDGGGLGLTPSFTPITGTYTSEAGMRQIYSQTFLPVANIVGRRANLSASIPVGVSLPVNTPHEVVADVVLPPSNDVVGSPVYELHQLDVRIMGAPVVASAVEAVVRSAAASWLASIDAAVGLNLTVRFAELPGLQLAQAVPLSVSDQGIVSGEIVVDVDAAGWQWFIDPTPNSSEEFVDQGGRLVLANGSRSFDLGTVVSHEIGHLLGFAQWHQSFASMTVRHADGSLWLESTGIPLRLDETGNELDANRYPDHLMAATLRPGQRKPVLWTESQVINSVWSQTQIGSQRFYESLSASLHGALTVTPPAFTALAASLDDSLHQGVVGGLVNGDFAVTSSTDSGFQWKTIGDISDRRRHRHDQ